MEDEQTYGQRVFLANLDFLVKNLPEKFFIKENLPGILEVACSLTGFEVDRLIAELEVKG
jgi:hypothetical protein